MKFLKTYSIILILSFAFMFFGGWQLFDFRERFWLATAACALVLTVIASVFEAQGAKIDQLEKRVKELEEKDRPTV